MKASCTGWSFVSACEPFDGRDVLAAHRAEPRDAGPRRLVVDHHRAGAAVAFTAAEFAARETELVAKNREQTVGGIAFDLVGPAFTRSV
jgi:hypothetical protein